MTTDFKIVEEPKRPIAMNPKKFALWLFLASVGMLFAAWTSGYLVRRSDPNWVLFDLPAMFLYSTIVIALSTIPMHLAYRAAKKNAVHRIRPMLWTTLALGIAFLVMQVLGWADLVSINAYFSGNPSGSFVYVLTGVHGVHIISAIIFLLIVINASRRYAVRGMNLAQMEMCATYWHFLTGLWVYLFAFLTIYR